MGSALCLFLLIMLISAAWINYSKSLPKDMLLVSLSLLFYAFIPLINQSLSFPYLPPEHLSLLLLTAWVIFGVGLRKQQTNLPWPFVLVSMALLFFFSFTYGSNRFSDLPLMLAGQDYLSYESQAFDILQNLSLRGGADIFYMQPLYRYWLAGLHFLFGDSLVSTRIIELTGLAVLTTSVAYVMIRSLSHPIRRRIGLVCGLLLGALITELTFWGVTYRSLSETLCIILILSAILSGWYFKNLTAVALFCSLSSIARYNMLPANIALFIMIAALECRVSLKQLSIALLMLMIVLCLPVLHNWVYGGSAVFFPPSWKHETNLIIHLSDYFHWPWSVHVWEHIENTVRNLTGIVGDLYAEVDVPQRIRFIQFLSFVSFIISVVFAVASGIAKRCWRIVLTVLPGVLAWAPFLIYKLDNYYPRLGAPGSILILCCCLQLLKETSPATQKRMEQN